LTPNTTPFYVFFGILGLVAGAAVVWFVLAAHPFEHEVRGGPVDDMEAGLIAKLLAGEGRTVDEATISRVIELHDAYFDGKINDSVKAAEEARLEAEWQQAEAQRQKDVAEMARRDVG